MEMEETDSLVKNESEINSIHEEVSIENNK